MANLEITSLLPPPYVQYSLTDLSVNELTDSSTDESKYGHIKHLCDIKNINPSLTSMMWSQFNNESHLGSKTTKFAWICDTSGSMESEVIIPQTNGKPSIKTTRFEELKETAKKYFNLVIPFCHEDGIDIFFLNGKQFCGITPSHI